MKRMMLGIAAAALATTAAIGAASAAEPAKGMDTTMKILVDAASGMTLYLFTPDGKDATKSTCVDKCIANWPPFLAPADAKAADEWTIVDVTDKDGKAAKMWAYDGHPLYFFVKDKKAGDVNGEGVGGVWFVVADK